MSFIGNISPQWIEAQYHLWRHSPEMVGDEWRAFFKGFELAGETPSTGGCLDPETAVRHSALHSLIHRYREMGHLLACTDPLSPCMIDHPLLSLQAFGLEPADLDRTFYLDGSGKPGNKGLSPLEGGGVRAVRLGEIVDTLRKTYCRSIGVEFMHISDPEQRDWLIQRLETADSRSEIPVDGRLAILGQLREASLFELFLNRKFLGQTRFSLEGGEVLIPSLTSW